MRFLLFLALSLITGCMPLQQIEWRSSTAEVRISPEENALTVTALTPTQNAAAQPSVDSRFSYAMRDGHRYPVSARKSSYVQPKPTYWTIDILELRDPVDSAKSLPWTNGEWHVHLEYAGGSTRPPIDARFRLWTFWYSPLIHGVPN